MLKKKDKKIKDSVIILILTLECPLAAFQGRENGIGQKYLLNESMIKMINVSILLLLLCVSQALQTNDGYLEE